jgi:uncharacterized protein YfbU (UPF0304 family)
VFFDPTDFLLIWDPRYGRHSRERVESGQNMTFVEAVFSFVFGDGDPNMSFEVRRDHVNAAVTMLDGLMDMLRWWRRCSRSWLDMVTPT